MFDWRRPFFFLLWCVGALRHYAEVWFYTRTPQWLLQGTPALLAAGAFLTVAVSFGASSRLDVVDRYNSAIDSAINRADYGTAELFLHKLLQIGDATTDVRYRLALVAEKQGDVARADDMMAEIAPDLETGHPGAHFWRAKHALAKQHQMTAVEMDLLTHHLQASLADAADNTEARSLLGQLMYAQRKYSAAAAYLSEIVKERPQWHVLLAKIYAAQGNRNAARDELKLATDEFQRKVKAEPSNTDARIVLAEAWALQGKFDDAEKTLLEGAKDADPRRCRQALASIYVLQFDAQAATLADDESRLMLLTKALELSPNHMEALLRLTKYLSQSGPAGQIAQAAIDKALKSPDVPPALLQILGANAARDGDYEMARAHLERAQSLMPQSPIVLNNLAWVLMHEKEPKLEQALTLANEAVERDPYNSDIRETRGQIFARMGRWSEALADLEMALGQLKGNPQLHTTVAHIYQRLGNSVMAERHQKLADDAKRQAEEAKDSPPSDEKAEEKE